MERANNPRAELSSIATALDDLTSRVVAISERVGGTELDWLATTLHEAERSLGAATMRLGVALDRLRR